MCFDVEAPQLVLMIPEADHRNLHDWAAEAMLETL